MNSNDLQLGALFTTDGNDLWMLESYFDVPSCTMLNAATGERQTFGIGGLTSQTFTKIDRTNQ